MKDQRLLASAALFRKLYDNNKDIYDVVSEFIRASILLNSRWVFNSTKCTQDLKSTFGFDIPDAVVNTCLKNRLKRSGELTLDHGNYSVTDTLDRSRGIQADFDAETDEYNEITTRLITHVRKRSTISVDDEESKKIISCFNDYLLDEGVSSSYGEYISHFLLTNQEDEGFRIKLNQIEEGLILYAGIKYSSELSSLGHWPGDLVVFLDTEHLFSATGLNGLLYKQLFDDFNMLVKEVNANKRKSGSIKFQYFEETQEEVERFFYAAEKIVANHKHIDPSKTAMITLVNGCDSKSDVLLKKTNFLARLKTLKIELENTKNYYENHQYNIESTAAISSLQDEINNEVESEKYSRILKLFTKINNLRSGVNNIGIERISAIFMTERNLTRAVAFSDVIYAGKGEIPFSTNIEFLTERLWFKLNKGFGKGRNTPASFDVVTKAKLVLSSQVNHAVAETYKEMKTQYSQGKISEKEVALLITELRHQSASPEKLTNDTIDDSFEFIKHSLIETVLREKTILEKKSKEGERAAKRVRTLEHEQRVNQTNPIKRVALRQYYLLQVTIYLLIPILLIYILVSAYSPSDTKLSLLFGSITAIGFIASVVKFKIINKHIWKLSRKYYKRKLLNLKKTLNTYEAPACQEAQKGLTDQD